MRLPARSFVIPFALCWLLMLASIPAAFAQKRKKPELPPAPPPVVSREVTVIAGESIAIPLGIHGQRAGQLEFLTRNPPKAGKLSAITATGANSATVTYTAPADTTATEDRFAYAVRSNEGVSAPGIVTIKLMPKPVLPGRLEAPESLAFPKTFVGQHSVISVEISNPGAGAVSGEISVNAPWSVDGSPSYRLESKDRATLKLRFRPEKAGAVSGEAVLGPQPRRVVALSGEGQFPLTVNPARLKITASDRGQTRMGTLEIENLSDEPRVITLTTGARLMTEKTVEIAGRTKAQVPFFAEPGDGSAFQEVARLSAGDWRQDIPVEVEPLKSNLTLSHDGAEELRGIAGRPAEFTVLIKNEGGRAATATVTASPPFASIEPKVTIGAGETKRVKIAANAVSAGEHALEISAETEAAVQRLKLGYTAEPDSARPKTAAPPRAMAPALVPATGANEPTPVEATASVGRALAFPETSPFLQDHPNALGNFAEAVGVDRATLAWPADLGETRDLAVEERRMAIVGAGNLAITWARLENVSFRADGKVRRADLTRLEPGKLYTVRVRGGGETLFTAQFTTKPKPPLIPFGWTEVIVGALVVVLAVLIWRQWKNRQRSNW